MPGGNPNRFSGVERMSQHVTSLMRTINEIENVSAYSVSAVQDWAQQRTSGAAISLSSPWGVTVDTSDNLYITDYSNDRVRKVNASGVLQLTFGSTGSGNGQLDSPGGVAVDASGNIYVVDELNDRVQKFNSSGVYQSQFGSTGSGNGQFATPIDIAIDASGNLFVTDWYNDRVQKFNSSGVYQSQFGSTGSGNGQFIRPSELAIDDSGNIYVVDELNDRVQKFNSSGVYQSQFGSTGSGNGQFDVPAGIAIDLNGAIYVTDQSNYRVQKFNSSGVYQSQFGSSGSGDGEFNLPLGIVTDSVGNIQVVDRLNNRVQKFNSSGVYQSQFGSDSSWSEYFDFGAGASSNVCVSQDGAFVYASGLEDDVTRVSAAAVIQVIFGTTGSGNGQFSTPLGLAADASGNVYVVDSGNARVQKFSAVGVYQSQFGSSGSGDGQFSAPSDIAIDSAGNLYVVDSGNDRIQKFNSSGVYQAQWGSAGTGASQFQYAQSIAIDTDDLIYVLDSGASATRWVQVFNTSGVHQSSWTLQAPTAATRLGIDAASTGRIHVCAEYDGTTGVQIYTNGGVHVGVFSEAGDTPRGSAEYSGSVYVAFDDASDDYLAKYTLVVTVAGGGDQTTWTWKLTGGTTKDMGVPDAGLHVPATDALYTGPPDSELGAGVHYDATAHWTYVVDARNAIQGIVGRGLINNPVTGNAFNWDENSADNLYFVAMNDKRTMFGATGSKYTWERTLYKRSHTDIDIGEIDACVKTLRAAAVTQGLLT